jgi:hypothetical protein
MLLQKLNQKLFLKIKRTGGDPSSPTAETAHEQRGRVPAETTKRPRSARGEGAARTREMAQAGVPTCAAVFAKETSTYRIISWHYAYHCK